MRTERREFANYDLYMEYIKTLMNSNSVITDSIDQLINLNNGKYIVEFIRM